MSHASHTILDSWSERDLERNKRQSSDFLAIEICLRTSRHYAEYTMLIPSFLCVSIVPPYLRSWACYLQAIPPPCHIICISTKSFLGPFFHNLIHDICTFQMAGPLCSICSLASTEVYIILSKEFKYLACPRITQFH